ncbi:MULTISPECIES: Npun_R2479 family HD domain-containing metalloprotein [unclassified Coleofasciculus]|uniref:Npun_R2479 family HD domain-containing metalloprotein n=1 Tax=unclassified Coleofasciculus TaxID=2692782 RepID=UPI0018802B62|nr:MULTISPECIES: Npun_R2479 family HD domain-containing metalloprotein [unclassified Coleofasciculus]MBE9127693.1 metal-dependent phosphohydrolase [Coleofasciculus sp. LEGE 07081]MBE9151031.1 metal-dependent phosphohydrolase [Coleofasciculus sp. LEGE 07092]
MLSFTEVMIRNCVERLQAAYCQTYGNVKPDYAELIGWVANVALGQIANSDALYHNVEHTILVTLVGQEVLRGKQICEGCISCEDWLHSIISWLCHDIGYVRGICQDDRKDQRLYAIGLERMMIALPQEATDASLTPYHVDRGKLFIKEYFGSHPLINVDVVKCNIELTRFPVPANDYYKDTENYPGLTRAADLIGQLSDLRYLKKIPALFYEFKETGANKTLGYRNPGDLRRNFPYFYRNVVFKYIQPALNYLKVTEAGQQIIANLHANVFQVEQENRTNTVMVR